MLFFCFPADPTGDVWAWNPHTRLGHWFTCTGRYLGDSAHTLSWIVASSGMVKTQVPDWFIDVGL